MRSYILTVAERKMARAYVKSGKKDRNFNSLLLLIRRYESNLEEDLRLVAKVSGKAGPAGKKRRGKKGKSVKS